MKNIPAVIAVESVNFMFVVIAQELADYISVLSAKENAKNMPATMRLVKELVIYMFV